MWWLGGKSKTIFSQTNLFINWFILMNALVWTSHLMIVQKTPPIISSSNFFIPLVVTSNPYSKRHLHGRFCYYTIGLILLHCLSIHSVDSIDDVDNQSCWLVGRSLVCEETGTRFWFFYSTKHNLPPFFKQFRRFHYGIFKFIFILCYIQLSDIINVTDVCVCLCMVVLSALVVKWLTT